MNARRVAVLPFVIALALACGESDAPSTTEGTKDVGRWPAYESPAGFTISYPPDWQVDDSEERSPPGGAKILNELRQQQTALEGADSGEAWVEIIPDAYPRFDVTELTSICSSTDTTWSNEGSETMLAGRQAFLCAGEGTDVYSGLSAEIDVYFVEVTPGHVVHIATYAVDTDDATKETLQAMLASVSFEDAP